MDKSHAAVKLAVQEHLAQALDLLEKMVGMPSHSLDRCGVIRVGEFYADLFAEMGFTAEWVEPSDTRLGRHLFLNRLGTGDKEVLLVGHLDTVFSEQELRGENFIWRLEGGRVFGPGTMDMKGGDIMVWLMLKALSQADPEIYSHTTWRICMNAAEELFTDDFAHQFLCRIQREKVVAALVMEFGPTEGDRYRIISQRRGKAALKVVVHGKGAHGGNHHQGASAVRQLAEVIVKLESMTDYAAGVTVNVGVVSGGETCTKIPHYAEAEVEVRAGDEAALDGVVESILALEGHSTVASRDGKYRAKVQVQLVQKVLPCPAGAGALHLLEVWQEAGRGLGIRVEPYVRGGLSDANFIGSHVPTLDGLGPGGGNPHISQYKPAEGIEPEWMQLESYASKAVLNCVALQSLLRE